MKKSQGPPRKKEQHNENITTNTTHHAVPSIKHHARYHTSHTYHTITACIHGAMATTSMCLKHRLSSIRTHTHTKEIDMNFKTLMDSTSDRALANQMDDHIVETAFANLPPRTPASRESAERQLSALVAKYFKGA